MQLGPNIWGAHLWKALHMISLGYPNEPNEEQKKNYKTFFENFYKVIPCSICSNNYKNNLKELPITNDTMKNQQNLVKWIIDIHNIVNKELKKPIIEHDDALLLIFNNFNNSHKHKHLQNKQNTLIKTSYTLFLLLIILFILISIAIIYKKN
jgi:hypothetical protein